MKDHNALRRLGQTCWKSFEIGIDSTTSTHTADVFQIEESKYSLLMTYSVAVQGPGSWLLHRTSPTPKKEKKRVNRVDWSSQPQSLSFYPCLSPVSFSFSVFLSRAGMLDKSQFMRKGKATWRYKMKGFVNLTIALKYAYYFNQY